MGARARRGAGQEGRQIEVIGRGRGSGHEPGPDRVIAERERFTIVEKTGEEGRLVARLDRGRNGS